MNLKHGKCLHWKMPGSQPYYKSTQLQKASSHKDRTRTRLPDIKSLLSTWRDLTKRIRTAFKRSNCYDSQSLTDAIVPSVMQYLLVVTSFADEWKWQRPLQCIYTDITRTREFCCFALRFQECNSIQFNGRRLYANGLACECEWVFRRGGRNEISS